MWSEIKEFVYSLSPFLILLLIIFTFFCIKKFIKNRKTKKLNLNWKSILIMLSGYPLAIILFSIIALIKIFREGKLALN